jgi:hypothetical protein
VALAIAIDVKDLPDQEYPVAGVMIGPKPTAFRGIENDIGLELIARVEL